MPLSTYVPEDILVIVGGAIIDGYADGTFINVERDEDTFSKKTGANGRTTRTKSSNKSGSITLTLQQTSPSNDVLSAFHAIDEQTANGVIPVLIKDKRGTSLYSSPAAWVKKPAAASFAKESENREWTLDCADLEGFTGGNPTFG